jgi:serine protease Do
VRRRGPVVKACYDPRAVMLIARIGLAVACLSLPSLVSAQAPPTRSPSLADLSHSLQDLAARVSPSVVQIFVTGYAAPEEHAAASAEPVLERSSGSGVIVDAEGYIVTNAHVVENARRIEVELPFEATGGAAGRSILRRRGRVVGAQIVAADRETDVAVLRVDVRGLPALPFGDSETLRPGQIVLAFGSPLGLESSVTMGVVSAVARQLAPDDPMIYIQTDAPINPGNSGGALVDTEGRLVGINTLIYSQGGGSEGIGFAAPSDIVRNVFQQIRTTGRVRRGEIGVNAQTITPLMAEGLDLPFHAGVILSDVPPGSPAARAGLQPGDVVLSLDGKPMENGRQFRINIYTRGAGERVALEVRRGQQTVTVRVPVGERDSGMVRLEELIGPQQAVARLGVVAIELTPVVADLLPPLRRDRGAVVARVAADAPFSQQGRILPGDVIYAVNGKPIDGVEGLKAAVAALAPNQAAVLHLEREQQLMYLAFRVEAR